MSAESTRRYRERYGLGYQRGYNRAKERAVKLFRERFPEEWLHIMAEETAGTRAAEIGATHPGADAS